MPALRSKSLFSGPWPLSREGTRGGAEKPDYEKKVSNRGVSRGKRFRNLLFPKESSPLKRSHFFEFFKKSGPRANEPWGHPPQICREKKSPMPHTSERKDG